MRGASWLAATNAPAWLERVGEQLAAEEIVACSNGLLHLPSLKLLPAPPKFFTYNALDFAFARRALKPSQWLAFLDQLWPDDQESIDTLQEFFGYCLTGDTCQQKLFLLVGPKRSGKGTIARVLAELVGRANSVAPTLAGIGSNFGLAPLIGKRVAIISDARLGGRADQHAITEHLLSITGEDLITIDRKFQAAWTGQLQTRFMIISNELPRLTDSSGALASRFIILLLRNSFYGAEDHELLAKLSKEMPGILNWAVDGWKRLASAGHFRQPATSLDAVQQFEDLASPIGAFLREKCETGSGFEVGAESLFAAWKNYCTEQGRDHPGTASAFGKDLHAALPWLKIARARVEGERLRFYQGIRLKS